MLTALAIAGVLVALFLAAALATRESEALAPVSRDAADVALPAGPVRADDVRQVRFGLALRGYRMSEVDAVLERFAAELDDRDRRLSELAGAVAPVAATGSATEQLDTESRSERPLVPLTKPAPPASAVVPEPVTAPDTHPVVVAEGPSEATGSHPVVARPAQAPVASRVVVGPAPTQQAAAPRTEPQGPAS